MKCSKIMTRTKITAAELDDLSTDDQLHVTLDNDRTLPLTVQGVKPNGNVRVAHDGQRVGYINEGPQLDDGLVLVADATPDGWVADIEAIEVES